MRERAARARQNRRGDRNHTPRETDGDKWTKSQREGGVEGETEKEDGERVQRRGVMQQLRSQTPTHYPCPYSSSGTPVYWPRSGIRALPGDKESLSRGPHSAKSPRDSQDYLQAGPGPGCLLPPQHLAHGSPSANADNLNSTQRALRSQSFQPRH